MMIMVVILAVPSEAARRHRAAPAYTPKYAAIVMDADTGHVYESEDADGRRHPASLTKMMTLYIVFEELRRGHLKLSTHMPVSAHAARQAPSKLGLNIGQTITVGEAIQALVTKSANDAAVVIAEYLAGSEAAFARRMTQKALSLGMRHTTFKNASGLPNPLQVTTARDMATLSRALYRDFPKNYGYFKQKNFIHKGVSHRNHNHLLGKVPGVDGIKTGFIGASGFNLAASAVRYDAAQTPHRLIVVVLGGPNRHWRDKRVTDLLEANFQRMGVSQGKQSWVETKYTVPQKEESQELRQDQNTSSYLEDSVKPHEVQGQKGQNQEDGIQEVNMQEGNVTEIDVNQLLADLPQGGEILSNEKTTVRMTPAGWVQATPTASEMGKNAQPIVQEPKKKLKQIVKNVQVGTFHRHGDAQKAAQDFQQLAGQGKISTSHYDGKKGKKRFYIAQVNQISKDALNKACQRWRAKGNECLIK